MSRHSNQGVEIDETCRLEEAASVQETTGGVIEVVSNALENRYMVSGLAESEDYP